MSEQTPQSIRRIVAARAHGYCEYCRCSEDFATESFTVEHIKPRQAGGETILENLAWSCFGCNGHKHTKTQATDPETGEKSSLYHPRQQVWSEHFSWSDDFTEIIGATAEGRATVEALHLNRFGVVNLRRLLKNSNLHPPGDFVGGSLRSVIDHSQIATVDRLISQVDNTENLPILSSLNHQPDNISDLMLRHPTQPYITDEEDAQNAEAFERFKQLIDRDRPLGPKLYS